ncbi:hypothetical protein [Streptomyces sp. NPDC003327]
MADQQDGGEREPQPIDEEAAWAAIVAGYGEEPADPPGTRPFRPIENLALPEADTVPEPEPEPRAEPKAEARAEREASGEPALVKDRAGADDPDDADEADDAEGPKDTVDADGPDTEGGVEARAGGDDRDAEPDDGPRTPPAPEAGTDRPALGSSVVFAPGVRPSGPRDYTPAEPEDGPGGDEGHFVPPEPPPLPEADAATKFAWLGVVGGPVLMLVAVLLQWDMTWWLTTLCVGGFLGGFATLVARMKHDDEDDDGFDDPGRGAVV